MELISSGKRGVARTRPGDGYHQLAAFVSQVTLGLPHTKEPLWARACLEAGLARSHRKAQRHGLAVELGQIVGAGLLAKAVGQLQISRLTHRFREQARSHIWNSFHPVKVLLLCFCPAFASS
ncbi:hypothetical protein, partial [Pseudomonas sp. AP19]|uniref:hypothetical protein n=1 Tax=Pseudomonas sp. AP19 TaxID=1535623 RepID=UPI001C492316